MIRFVGRCVKISISALLLCQNETRFIYTTIADSVHDIQTGEYIRAALDPVNAKVNTYTIGILFSRSFRQGVPVTGRRLNDMITANVLTLRVAYNNSEPTATEVDLSDGFWDDTRNRSVNTIFYESSYGELQFNKETSLVATVHLNASIESTHIGACDIGPMFALVVPVALAAGIDVRAFTHIQYVIPIDYGSACDWLGLSAIGCSVPGGFLFENCFAVLRNPTVFARAHELGHNFGMLHATGCGLRRGECIDLSSTAYGDASAIMGGASNPDRVGGFIAPYRINMGWMGNITDGSRNGRFAISALATWPSPDDAAVRIPYTCPASLQLGDSCEIILSYRVPTRVDSTIMDVFAYTVSVHLKSATKRSNTLLLISLGRGESYTLLTGKLIVVCETWGSRADVVIGDAGGFGASCDETEVDSVPIIIGVLVAFFVALLGGLICIYLSRDRMLLCICTM